MPGRKVGKENAPDSSVYAGNIIDPLTPLPGCSAKT